MTKYLSIGLTLLVVATGSVAGVYAHRCEQLRRSLEIADAKAKKFDDHCRFLRTALEQELAELSSQRDPAGAPQLIDRLFEQLSSPEASLVDCTNTPPDSARLVTCWASHDHKCVEEIAKSAVAGLKR
jgi:hypothetical protein